MYLSDIVSIHLMLLFIRSVVNPCYKLDIVSIHLMLLFIPAPWEPPVLFLSVSIHLMLLFIAVWWRFSISTRGRFNTSHVTLYRGRRSGLIDMDCCFNTSHVTLYRVLEIRLTLNRPKFQYISCYSLSYWLREVLLSELVSIHLMLLFINIPLAVWLWPDTFQYISCYSLSKSWNTGKQQRIAFQYISCYSLSDTGCKVIYFPTVVSIHLMLLFIAFLIVKIINYIFVSIHLMLLFIA